MTAFADDYREPVAKTDIGALAGKIWFFALAGLLVPSLAAWTLRGFGYALHCPPSAAACLASPFGGMLGAGLKATLDLAWMVGAHFPVTAGLTLVGGLAAVVAARPLRATLTVLLAPLAALLLPVGLIAVTTYPGCAVNANGAGDCVVWGRSMGMTFHTAATAPELIYNYTPFAVAGALVAGLLGWIVRWGYGQMAKTHQRF